ncbi:DnaD domain protein [Enterococcus sp. LJL90]
MVRRMISTTITDSASFLKLPNDSKVLWYKAVEYSDDDGCVDVYKVMNLLRSKEDDLNLLIMKHFLIPLPIEDVHLVANWKEMNRVEPKKYRISPYQKYVLQVNPAYDFGYSAEDRLKNRNNVQHFQQGILEPLNDREKELKKSVNDVSRKNLELISNEASSILEESEPKQSQDKLSQVRLSKDKLSQSKLIQDKARKEKQKQAKTSQELSGELGKLHEYLFLWFHDESEAAKKSIQTFYKRFGFELTKVAMEKTYSKENIENYLGFISTLLMNWKEQGVTTVQEVNEEQRSYNQQAY